MCATQLSVFSDHAVALAPVLSETESRFKDYREVADKITPKVRGIGAYSNLVKEARRLWTEYLVACWKEDLYQPSIRDRVTWRSAFLSLQFKEAPEGFVVMWNGKALIKTLITAELYYDRRPDKRCMVPLTKKVRWFEAPIGDLLALWSILDQLDPIDGLAVKHNGRLYVRYELPEYIEGNRQMRGPFGWRNIDFKTQAPES